MTTTAHEDQFNAEPIGDLRRLAENPKQERSVPEWDGEWITIGQKVILDCDPSILEYGADQVGQKHEVVALLPDENCVVLRLSWGLGVFSAIHCKDIPIKSERQKVVDALETTFITPRYGVRHSSLLAEELYDSDLFDITLKEVE